MILLKSKIEEEIKNGNITIKPFDKSKLNPNSYNLTLNNKLLVYTEDVLDMKKQPKYEILIIPEEGLILEPGKLYLGMTNEFTHTDKYVPMLEGRSSIGRLGMTIHITAGFGDIGFGGNWTLEIMCIHPIKIYPNVDICQIYYHTGMADINNNITSYGSTGKYQGSTEPLPSMMWKDFIRRQLK